ncbi:VOC family protein [Streptomyces sp. NPDC059785]|uniref:VOC family protein n=1 Tax=unclassified Streptomyces TaxID=2593676 RepID=UPI00364D84C3
MIRFDHVGLSVPDLEAAARWYCAALGLSAAPAFQVAGTDLRGVMLLHDSGYRVELLHRPGARPGPVTDTPLDAAGTLGFGHMCLCVEDVDAEFARLTGLGATTAMAPQAAPRPGARMAFVRDPYGNLIELLDRK